MKPLRNLIAVKPCLPDEVSEGGLIIPENIRERSSKAKIIAVGDKSKLKIGYTVWHIKGAGTELIENNESVFLMPDNEVLGYTEN